jgi:NAD(P)-dependent dehydrogenase (short-subunit alcohol dehydrogenase family)
MSGARFRGKVAIVTGGASGIGKAMVQRFLADGAQVIAADLNQASGDELLADLSNDHVRFTRVDVSKEADVAAMVELAITSFGRLDVICNNAGFGGAFGPITDLHVEDWDETFAVLVRGVFLGCKHAVPHLIAAGGGAIVNTASVAGVTGGGGPVAYSGAKSAVINMTRALAVELAPHRIRVNAVCPGPIRTPLLAQGRKGLSFDEMPRMQPWPDPGLPEHIAATAAFLASDDAAFITGEAINVDGGLTAAGPSAAGVSDTAPAGWVGMNRGTTGQRATVHRRG